MLLTGIIISLICTVVSAEPVANFKADDLSLNLKLDAGETGDELVTVSVDEDGKLSFDNCPEFAWVYEMPDDNIFDVDIKLPVDLESGRNYVYIDTSSQHYCLEVYIHNIKSQETIDICDELCKISDKDEFVNFAVSNANHLGIDAESESVSNNIEEIVKALYHEISRSSDKSPLNIAKCSKMSTAYALLINGENTEEVIAEYNDVLNIDEDILTDISDDLDRQFKKLIEESTNEDASIDDVITECLAVASLTSAGTWNDIKNYALLKADDIGIDVGKSSKFEDIPSKRQYEVFVELFDKKDDIKSYSDFKKAFDRAVKKILDKINDNPGSSGGGGSSSSKSNPVTVPNSFLNKTPEENENKSEVQITFTDISGHFSESYVMEMAALNIISGYEDNSFRPDKFVTRAEFVSMISKALKLNTQSSHIAFEDVSGSDWFYNAVAASASEGYVSGYNGYFNPANNITRQDVCVIINNIIMKEGGSPSSRELTYNDGDLISDYAREAVKNTSNKGIVNGYEGYFRPLDNMTRGEAAAVIARLLELLNVA